MYTDFVVEVSPSVEAEKNSLNNLQTNNSNQLETVVEVQPTTSSLNSLYNFRGEGLW